MKPLARVRHRGRVAAAQIVYQLELSGGFDALDEALERTFEHLSPETPPEVRAFAEELCRGVASSLEEIDELIGRASRNWRVDRMSRVDLGILRVASYELLSGTGIAPAVVINEAVEIAKEFGTGDSASFINGVLSRVAEEAEELP
jgi:transcription antitermination protein NusB